MALTVLGVIADTVAIVPVIAQSTKHEPPPWWAVVVFGVGLVLILKYKNPPSDFVILDREILVDIKSWARDANGHQDLTTTYRIDRVKCTKKNCRKLVYEEMSCTGSRSHTDILNFPFTLSPVSLHPGAEDLTIDLGQECAYGKKYTVISRHEYSNTFPDPQHEYYANRTNYPTKRIKITILFPANRHCADASVSKKIGASTESQVPLPTISENGRVITWRKKRLDFNAKYKLSWSWESR